ncbi:PKD domain-containing protein [Nocardia tengchongensis]|uniref:PKD domain-containing protein n=1 Tax=Nocardia tengchongensis TaxID=2055889 RepID=UPI00367F5004
MSAVSLRIQEEHVKLWRSRRCPAALLPALAGAIAVAGVVAQAGQPLPARAEPSSDLPLVIDVSAPQDGQCTGPLRGTTAVYFPPGVGSHAEVEWRILGGGQPIRSGITVVQNDVMTVGFDIRHDELPADGLLRVDARARVPGGEVGGYGKPWNFRVNRDCRPLHVVSVGDSVLWGQSVLGGVSQDRKHRFATVFADALGARTARGATLHDYTASGAALDAPAEHPSGKCPGGDATLDVFCQLAKATADATANGYPVDLVLLDGCLNDLDPVFGIPVGITPGTQDLAAAVHRECGGVGADAVNPAAAVPYFSGAALGYGGRGMRDAVQAAHQLPGMPKVLVGNYFHGYDGERVPESLTQRWSEFVRVSSELFRQAAADANAAAGEEYAAAADGLFTQEAVPVAPDAAPGARDIAQPVDRTPAMNPLGDEAVSLRLLACPPANELPQCRAIPSVTPADLDAARKYAEAFLLNPRISEWFGGSEPFGDGFTASKVTAPPGNAVSFDAARAGGAIRRYDWYFGDGSHETTTDPAASHVYNGRGPNLPRLVVTDMTGHRSLYELAQPITVG